VLKESEYVIVESDALGKFWRPDLFLMVLNSRMADFKASAREVLPLVDAFVFRSPCSERFDSSTQGEGRPHFLQPIGQPLPLELQELIMHPFRPLPHPM
jgi:hypothetical protein